MMTEECDKTNHEIEQIWSVLANIYGKVARPLSKCDTPRAPALLRASVVLHRTNNVAFRILEEQHVPDAG
jgi:hypothetical protein